MDLVSGKEGGQKRYLRVKSHYPESFSGSSVTLSRASKVARVLSQLGWNNAKWLRVGKER